MRRIQTILIATAASIIPLRTGLASPHTTSPQHPAPTRTAVNASSRSAASCQKIRDLLASMQRRNTRVSTQRQVAKSALHSCLATAGRAQGVCVSEGKNFKEAQRVYKEYHNVIGDAERALRLECLPK